jgi:hypothetical protein
MHIEGESPLRGRTYGLERCVEQTIGWLLKYEQFDFVSWQERWNNASNIAGRNNGLMDMLIATARKPIGWFLR